MNRTQDVNRRNKVRTQRNRDSLFKSLGGGPKIRLPERRIVGKYPEDYLEDYDECGEFWGYYWDDDAYYSSRDYGEYMYSIMGDLSDLEEEEVRRFIRASYRVATLEERGYNAERLFWSGN